MKRYIHKPNEQRGVSYAACYEGTESIGDVLAVAQMRHYEVLAAEVPEFDILVVRYFNVSDEFPARTPEHTIVEAGHFLVYSETFDVLYTSEAEMFERDHQELGGETG